MPRSHYFSNKWFLFSDLVNSKNDTIIHLFCKKIFECLATIYLQENRSVRRSGILKRIGENGFPLFRQNPAYLDVDDAQDRTVIRLFQLGASVPVKLT
jgi:hypothetical protein